MTDLFAGGLPEHMPRVSPHAHKAKDASLSLPDSLEFEQKRNISAILALAYLAS